MEIERIPLGWILLSPRYPKDLNLAGKVQTSQKYGAFRGGVEDTRTEGLFYIVSKWISI